MTDPMKEDAKRSDSAEGDFQVRAPAVSLPKGGGAIRGIGEKFAANPVTGTGSMTVPIATSPGRSGFDPELSLSYDSGSGNGPFGFGWTLSLPSITRKTDKGIPQYRDAEESDVFILSGAEDLVPVLVEQDGQWQREMLPPRTVNGKKYQIQRYRPRIEGLFARIERWTNRNDPKDSFWRSISRDNITSWYGKTSNSRIADPSDSSRIFSWLICESHDDKGNVIVYKYKKEDSSQIELSQTHEANRTPETRSANRYLKFVCYGNHKPYFPKLAQDQPWPQPADEWLFEVVFDYGEHDSDMPTISNPGSWICRMDPFSSYRAGFEVRTYRLCRRVLMFHHFRAELGVDDYLVRSTEFEYEEGPVASFLKAVTQSGHKRDGDHYLKKSLPPVEFGYSKAEVQDKVEEIDAESLKNLPYGLDGATYQWVDLNGDGIPGIISQQGDSWFYKVNLSPANQVIEEGKERTVPCFGPVDLINSIPSAVLAAGGGRFLDLAGDGQLDLVTFEGALRGFYERTDKEGWASFRPFTSWPDIDIGDPNLRFVDLNGDGHADILVTENDVLTWYPSLAEKGFGPAQKVRKPLDEEEGPHLVFADGTQSIYLADMSGAGLSDLIRIRNGEVCYWPSLGYGRFGAKVTMDNAPWFDTPDHFDQRRIRIADIDGSGNTDIIYLNSEGADLYFNHSGNAWSEPHSLNGFPHVDSVSTVMTLDLLGNGTACLAWSSPLPGDSTQPMYYVDLMGGQKPHLLVKAVNNLGAETRVQYAPSTKFYLQDKRDGKPWITRLPFPVHVVEHVETYDHISRNRHFTRYAYHHGYFDGEDRELRGFGMVEQSNSEEFATLEADGKLEDTENLDKASHIPPVRTRTWFHNGAYLDREHISRQFECEYYREPGLSLDQARALLLPDTILPEDLTIAEEREACRALKGSMLRQEVYADDAGPEATADQIQRALTPYTVTEQNFTVRRLQHRGGNRHAVFFTHARETISYHYERNPDDPRISHALTLEVDKWGNVKKSLAIGYGRKQGRSPLQGDDKKKQEQTLITYTEGDFTNAIDLPLDDPDNYRAPLPSEVRTFELTGRTPGNASRFSFNGLVDNNFEKIQTLSPIPYEQEVDYSAPEKRLIECVRTLYRANDLSGFLEKDKLESVALPGETYKLAFTPGVLDKIYKRPLDCIQPPGSLPPEGLLTNCAELLGGKGSGQGGYVDLDEDDHWWIPSGKAFYSPDTGHTALEELAYARKHFFLPHRYQDPFDQTSFVFYDDYDLLMIEIRDPLENRVTVGERDEHGNITNKGNDYRVLQPWIVTDPNRNQSAVAFDILGMVAGTALMGKRAPAPVEGDTLENFKPDLCEEEINGFYNVEDPHLPAPDLLKGATTRIIYDLDLFKTTQEEYPNNPEKWQPVFAATLARETHVSDPVPPLKIQVSFSYSDGFGREIQKKIQAEPGPVQGLGNNIDHRWVGSGWTIFNNKGNPVRQYEPFFDDMHKFKFGHTVGVSPILFYDPLERVVATLHPNHTYEKVVFDPWQRINYDVNDTCAQRNQQTGDPRTDPDINGYVTEYFKTQPADWQTWYQQRINKSPGDPERDAAQKAAVHADTPAIAHFDSLGRPFLTITHNRVICSGHALDNTEDMFATRVELDIEGNQRAVVDAKNRVVMRCHYSMFGPDEDDGEEDTASNLIHQASMEAGEGWMLNDVVGNPIRAWDSRDFARRMTYDELRRPTGLYVTENGTGRLAEKTIYGENQGDAFNHRGQVYQQFDQAGVVTQEHFDFKGNLCKSRRQFQPQYKQTIDWKNTPPSGEIFSSSTTFDALNRSTSLTTPHTVTMQPSVIRPSYNEANLLDKVEGNLRGAAVATTFVENIVYDAKGQRKQIDYSNGTYTKYDYDPLTFRLINMKTIRPAGLNGLASKIFADPTVVQDLSYTYDPAGNITRIADAALKQVNHDNQLVEPVCSYTYDALYRLIEAKGREHIGQTTALALNLPAGKYRDHPFTGLTHFIAHPNDIEKLRNYMEQYEYDAVGNFDLFRHTAKDGNWTRRYEYNENSLLEAGKQSNRLSRTIVGNKPPEDYTHDVHGNMTSMPHLTQMGWDFEDQLQQVDLGGGGTSYYVYDAGGERVRKVIESQNGTKVKERIYLNSFEIYREYNGNGTDVALERETLHVMDDQQRIAVVETKTQPAVADPVIRYQLGNHLGSASVELAEDGELISYEEYHPYGTTSFQAGRSAAELSLKRYRYTGKERDKESGLNYHGARYYAPWLGRWINTDPIDLLRTAWEQTSNWATRRQPERHTPTQLDSSEEGDVDMADASVLNGSVDLEDGKNLYVYGRNNPAILNDPDGRKPKWAFRGGPIDVYVDRWLKKRGMMRPPWTLKWLNASEKLSLEAVEKRFREKYGKIGWPPNWKKLRALDKSRANIRNRFFSAKQVVRNWYNRYGNWCDKKNLTFWQKYFYYRMIAGIRGAGLYKLFQQKINQLHMPSEQPIMNNPFGPSGDIELYNSYRFELETRDPTSLYFNPNYRPWIRTDSPSSHVDPPSSAQDKIKMSTRNLIKELRGLRESLTKEGIDIRGFR